MGHPDRDSRRGYIGLDLERIAMNLSATQLNQALRAYISTVPNEERLHAHLDSIGLGLRLLEFQERLRPALEAAENYLWAQRDGVKWTDDFENRLFEYVRRAAPWLDRDGFASICSFGKWLCLREGLNPTELP